MTHKYYKRVDIAVNAERVYTVHPSNVCVVWTGILNRSLLSTYISSVPDLGEHEHEIIPKLIIVFQKKIC